MSRKYGLFQKQNNTVLWVNFISIIFHTEET